MNRQCLLAVFVLSALQLKESVAENSKTSCEAYGNKYELVPGSDCKQYNQNNTCHVPATLAGTISCPQGTLFDVSICVCNHASVVICPKEHQSCNEIKNANPSAASGLYEINTNVGTVEVYCEMSQEGGGFTFIPKDAVSKKAEGKSLDLSNIFLDKKNVLLFLRLKTGDKQYTLINQLPAYQTENLGAQINSYQGYTRPLNVAMGDYLYFGILPRNLVNQRNTQGFTSNRQQVSFHNCDSNPNSYFVLYPNINSQPVNQYHHVDENTCVYERTATTVSRTWRSTALPVNTSITENYFFFAEMHFGGCGTYSDSSCWAEADGVAIGFR